MALIDNQIAALFSWDLFQKIASGESMSLYKVNIFTAMLVNSGIPFDMSFESGSRKKSPAIQITIYINPVTTLVFNVGLGPGENTFSPTV